MLYLFHHQQHNSIKKMQNLGAPPGDAATPIPWMRACPSDTRPLMAHENVYSQRKGMSAPMGAGSRPKLVGWNH